MAEAEMDEFLLAKLQSGIDRNIPYASKFSYMKNLLHSQLHSPTHQKHLCKIRQHLHLLNNIMDEIPSEFVCLSFRFRIRTSLNRIKKGIVETGSAPETGSGVGFSSRELAPLLESNQTGSATKKSSFSSRELATKEAVGFEADFLAVRNLILYRNYVGIVGAEGVGKTTLAQLVFALEEVVDRFVPRIWVSLSDDSNEEEDTLEIGIAKRILGALGVSEEGRNGSSLAALMSAIRVELMGKMYLIVLDGATRDGEWYRDLSLEVTPGKGVEERLAFAFPKGSGGAVLVVGWAESVVEGMVGGDGSGVYRLLPLEDPGHCWGICKEEVGGEEGEDEKVKEEVGGEEGEDEKVKEEVGGEEGEDEKVKEEVVKRCSGHPGAARLMGRIKTEMVMKRKNQEAAAASANQADAAV